MNEYRFKKELHDEINGLLVYAASICAKTIPLYFKDPKGILPSYNLVLPFPPTVYSLYQNYVDKFKGDKASKSTILEITDFERLMFEGLLEPEDMLYLRYRLYTFNTLQKTALELLQNTYSPERVDRVVVRVN